MILIGIDPGTTTGVGIWDKTQKKIVDIRSGGIIEMYHYVMAVHQSLYNDQVKLYIEDARKRKWYGTNTKGKAQGAGSIKRDCKIWEEICTEHNWDYEMIHPIKGATKMNHKQFCRITGYTQRTNEHGRDATMLVYGLGRLNI
jgi:predicted glycosyltransferase involved in capsule biosynthesis